MKAKAVSAFRSKRGFRRVNGAEPQVVGLTPQTTNERKTDTMKRYILRPTKSVESQKSIRPPRPKPAVRATTAVWLGRPEANVKGPVLFIGLDVHNDSIAVSLAPSDAIEVRRYGIIDGEHEDVLKLAKKLAGGTLAFCALTGVCPGEPKFLLRQPPLAETLANLRNLAPCVIFPDRSGQLRMEAHRLKHGQNPFVLLDPAAENFLVTWRAWIEVNSPNETRLFPSAGDDQTSLNRALNAASTALGLARFKPRGFGRAFFVKVRRSQRADDATIAGELGQTTNGDLIRSVYGDPQDLHGGVLFDWLPEDRALAWNLLAVKPTKLDTVLMRPVAGNLG
jgi:hypothetical protein